MKKNASFKWLIVLVVATMLWILWERKNRQTIIAHHENSVPLLPQQTPFVSVPLNVPETNVEYEQIKTQGRSYRDAISEANRRLEVDPRADWKVKLSFFGCVVDEHNNPVKDVQVHFQWTDNSSQGTSNAYTKSDNTGHFELASQHGKYLVVKLEKDGYYVPKQNTDGFEYANPGAAAKYYEPDPKNPYIFQLRKMRVQAALKKSDNYIPTPHDGSVVGFDLASAKVAPNGQLKIQTWKPPEVGNYFPYDWRVVIELTNGGFVEQAAEDEFGFVAPSTNYTDRIDLRLRATDGMAGSSVTKHLFFKMGNPPQYGRMTLQTDGQGESVHIKYALNLLPNDRNLE